MANIIVKVTLPLLEQGIINDKILPRVHEAVGAIAVTAQTMWQKAVMHAPGIWAEDKKAYAGAIQWEYTGPLNARVFTGYKYAMQIETGRPQRDLKQMLQTSDKVRISHSKKHAGQKYLIIPFRHNTPGNDALAPSMPQNVYQAASQLSQSSVTGKTTRPSGKNPQLAINKNVYAWGSTLPSGMAPKLKPSHKTDPYANMYKFNTSSGGQKSSAYLTFRVMGAWSSGWIVGAKPGLYIAREVAKKLEPTAQKIIWRAVILDAV